MKEAKSDAGGFVVLLNVFAQAVTAAARGSGLGLLRNGRFDLVECQAGSLFLVFRR